LLFFSIPCRSRPFSFDAYMNPRKPKENAPMRFMVFVPASKDSEAGQLPTAEMISEMSKFNEELVRAGVLLAGEGLAPSSKGARVVFEDGKKTVLDGPFTGAKDLVAGYWILQVKSKEEAVEWIKRAPFGKFGDQRVAIEIRQIFDPADFAPVDPTGELRKKEAELRAMAEQQQRSSR
jgi:hypothetical protein